MESHKYSQLERGDTVNSPCSPCVRRVNQWVVWNSESVPLTTADRQRIRQQLAQALADLPPSQQPRIAGNHQICWVDPAQDLSADDVLACSRRETSAPADRSEDRSIQNLAADGASISEAASVVDTGLVVRSLQQLSARLSQVTSAEGDPDAIYCAVESRFSWSSASLACLFHRHFRSEADPPESANAVHLEPSPAGFRGAIRRWLSFSSATTAPRAAAVIEFSAEARWWWWRALSWLIGFFRRLIVGSWHGPEWPQAWVLTGSQISAVVSQTQRPLQKLSEVAAVLHWLGGAVEQGWLPVDHCKESLSADQAPRPAETVRKKLQREFQSFGEATRFWWLELQFRGSSPTASGKLAGGGWLPTVLGGLLGLLAIGSVLSLNLGYPLFEPDEARNAQLAMNIVETGEWWSLQLNGNRYWDKPPLVAWLTATAYSFLGVSETTTRLAGNLAAWGILLLTFALGRLMVGTTAAAVGVCCLLLSTLFVACGRYVTMDAMLTLTLSGTLWGAFLATRQARLHWGWWLFSAVFGGLGLLTKGPIVIVLSLPVLIWQHYLTGNRQLLSVRHWFWFGLVVLAIAGPWYLAQAWVHPDFVVYFFWKHHVVRFAEAFNHQEPWWYYFPVLFLAMFPASYLLPAALYWVAAQRRDWRDDRPPELGFLAVAAGWVLLFFSLSEAKLPTYILPALPSLALIIGQMFERRCLSGRGLSWTLEQAVIQAPRLLGVLTIGGWIYVLVMGAGPPGFAGLGGVVVAGMLGLTWYCQFPRNPWGWRWSAAALAGVLALSFIFAGVVPRVAERRSIHLAAKQLEEQPEFDTLPIVFYEHETYGSELWLPERQVVEFDDIDRHLVLEFLQAQDRAIVVSKWQHIDVLRRGLAWPLTLTPIAGARHLYLLDSRNPRTWEPRYVERPQDNGLNR